MRIAISTFMRFIFPYSSIFLSGETNTLVLSKITTMINARNEPNDYKFITFEYYYLLEKFPLRPCGGKYERVPHFSQILPILYRQPNFSVKASLEARITPYFSVILRATTVMSSARPVRPAASRTAWGTSEKCFIIELTTVLWIR